jgi:hypothetical protein
MPGSEQPVNFCKEEDMKKLNLFINKIALKGLIRSVGVRRFLFTRSDFSFRGFYI